MKKFDKVLSEQLAAMPIEDNTVKGKLDMIMTIQQDIQETQEQLAQLEQDLRCAVEEYNFALGGALRKRLPQVGVNFNNGRCSASYKSTNLSCKPDIAGKTWVFEPNQHGRRFSRRNSHLLPLSNELDPLVDALVSYLTGRYRSLG